MATLAASSSSSHAASPPFHRRRKSWARRIERCCCSTITHFPLVFVYGLTTWAIYVELNVAFLDDARWSACLKAALGILLYGIANASYTIAVFTNPGSPLDARVDLSSTNSNGRGRRTKGNYDVLPTYESDGQQEPSIPAPPDMTTVTAKSTGSPRYCKKCHTLKPDRTHHCSSCGRCVLKMDHHCPWLATCVGLRNYKAFLLFLIYTSLYCWLCFLITSSWVWVAITDDARMRQSWLVVNNVMLAVLSGIIGLVLSGFTGWHVYLVCRNETTIESLEKTRYLSPLRKSMAPAQDREGVHHLGDIEEGNVAQEQEMGLLDQLKETHANALPGILRPEEGESSRQASASPNAHHPVMNNESSPAKSSLQQSYASMEAQRERDRYNAYLDEQDSEKLPNAFNLGWRRNLQHVFGSRPLLWFLPICNTSGDGWVWEVSPKWYEARAEQRREREARMREEMALRELDQQSLQVNPHARFEGPMKGNYRWAPGQGFVSPSNGSIHGGSHMPMQPLDRRKGPLTSRLDGGEDVYDTSSDDESHWRAQSAKASHRE